MATAPRLVNSSHPDQDHRNRRTVHVLLVIIVALVVATILVGIKW
jgi:hypothetical protein